ncbi:MAG: hypothetical protein DRJ37_05495 [Thermoprotei archaeon]|nr:MAG: hypothetical protein DRJ37_05495 [Thermoprotei archaeon]
MDITADEIVKLFEENVRARKRLAELLVVEPDIRLAIINAVLRDVATKQDVKDMATKQDIIELRRELKKEIAELRSELKMDIRELRRNFEAKIEREVGRLEVEIDRLYKLVMISVLGILVSVTTTILVRILLP